MKAILRVFLVLLIPALFMGCAYSPVAIPLNPEVQLKQASVGRGRTFVIRVEDVRPRPELGSRGGAYKDSSSYTLANDLPSAIQTAVQHGMVQMGFYPAQDGVGDIAVTIRWSQLDYGSPSSVYPSKIEMAAAFTAVVENGPSTFEKNVKRSEFRRFPSPPSVEESEKALTGLVNQALLIMFNDPAFINAVGR